MVCSYPDRFVFCFRLRLIFVDECIVCRTVLWCISWIYVSMKSTYYNKFVSSFPCHLLTIVHMDKRSRTCVLSHVHRFSISARRENCFAYLLFAYFILSIHQLGILCIEISYITNFYSIWAFRKQADCWWGDGVDLGKGEIWEEECLFSIVYADNKTSLERSLISWYSNIVFIICYL